MKDISSRIFTLIVFTLLLTVNVIIISSPYPDDSEVEDGVKDQSAPNEPNWRSTRAGTDWPMFNFDTVNSGYTIDPGPITDDLMWYNQTGGLTYSSPAVVNGKVYIGSEDGSSNYGFMSSYYANNGTLAWRFRTYSAISGGYGLTSSPAVDNSLVFFGGDRIYCLYENNGTVKWTVTPGNANYGDGTPTVANGKLFMPGSDRRLYCIDQVTGTVLWRTQAFTGGGSNYGLYAAPAVVNGHVYQAAANGVIYKLDENGQPLPPSDAVINHSFTMAYASYTAAVVANGRVFVGSGYGSLTTSNRFYALNATDLSLIWEFYPGSPTSFFGSASFYNDRLYIPSRDGNLYCVDAMASGPTTTEYWRIPLGETWSSPAISGDRLYVGSKSNYLYCINLTQPATPFYYWRYNTGGDVDSSPAVVDGKVYVGTHGNSGRLYCFGSTVTYTVDYIEILDQPGGAGSPIIDQDVDVGMIITGYAAAYNDTQGYLNDLQVNWSVINGGGANASTSPANLVITSDFYSGFFGGTATWTADDGNGHSDLVFFTIDAPNIDFIEIVDTEGSGASAITAMDVGVGFTLQGYAAGFNDTIGYFGDVVVDWSVNNLSGAAAESTPLQGTNSTFNANFLGGIAIWEADDGGGHTYQVQLTILAPIVDYITIVDTQDIGSSEITGQIVDVGYSVSGYAAGFNNTVGYIGDISVTWSVINSNGAEGSTSPSSGTGSTLDAGLSGGTVEWWADDGASHLDSVTFTVNPPEIDYIIIMTGPNGTGSWVGGTTYTYGQSATFYAAGFNDTVGWVMDVDATWDSDNSSVGDVTTGPSNSTTFTAQNNGTCNINATYNTLSNTTGTITVIYYNVEYIIIRDAPGNGGSQVGDVFFNVGETANFYAAAYNSSAPGNYIGDVVVDWYVSNISVATVTTPGVSTLFSALFIGGVCNVTAIYGSSLEDVTGNLTVSSATLDYILITEVEDGPEVITATMNVGEIRWIFVSGYNATGPTYLGLVEVDWSQAPSVIGSFGSSPSESTTLSAGTSGGFTTIWATNIALNVSDNFTLTISDPTVDYILIRDAAGGSGNIVDSGTYMVFDTDVFYAAAYNITSSYLFDIDVAWSSSNTSVGRVTSPGILTTFTAQDIDGENSCIITATYNALISDSTGPLTVISITVDYIQIRDAPNDEGNIIDTRIYAVWEVDEFHAAAYSNLVGYLYDVEVTWGSNDTSTGQVTSPGVRTNFTAQIVDVNSTCIITARYSDQIFNTTGALTVLIRSVDFIQIRDESNSIVDGIELDIGEWVMCFAVGYNNTSGLMGYVPVTWSIIDNIVSLVPVDRYFTNVTATAAGTSTLSAMYNSDISNSTQVVVVTRISAPTGLTVTGLPQGGTLNISWDPMQNRAGYNLYRSLLPNAEFTKVNDELITTENFIDDGLTNNIRYYYYVVAVDNSSESSDPSDTVYGIPDVDTDGDGLLNYEDDDDDGDGLPDASESLFNTNPLLADTDGDGVDDGDDYYPTDPSKWDKTEEEDEASLIWILIPIIVIVALLLLLFILSKRRQPEETPPPSEKDEELPLPPEALAEEELPPPPEDFVPPPSEDEPPPPPEDGEPPPPGEEEELSPPPEDLELAPPPGDAELPPPPPWYKKPTSPPTKDK